MFTGLSAFPMTPMNENAIDEVAFVRLVERLVTAGVDSIGALGSTGNYAYAPPSLPLPLRTLEGQQRQALGALLEELK